MYDNIDGPYDNINNLISKQNYEKLNNNFTNNYK